MMEEPFFVETNLITALSEKIGPWPFFQKVQNGEGTRNILCVAFSMDGFSWEKPVLGEGHNIVMRSANNPMNWGAFHCQSVAYDPTETNPDWRWKLLFWGRRDPKLPPGFHFAGSADGLNWSPVLERPVIMNANDAGSFCLPNPRAAQGARDSSIMLYQQTWRYDPDLPVGRDNLDFMQRVISIWTCDPFPSQWVGPTQLIVPDDEDAPDHRSEERQRELKDANPPRNLLFIGKFPKKSVYLG